MMITRTEEVGRYSAITLIMRMEKAGWAVRQIVVFKYTFFVVFEMDDPG